MTTKAPSWALDPTTKKLMTDPVTLRASCNHTVDKTTAKVWIGQGNKVCPVCHAPLKALCATPNRELAEAISSLKLPKSANKCKQTRGCTASERNDTEGSRASPLDEVVVVTGSETNKSARRKSKESQEKVSLFRSFLRTPSYNSSNSRKGSLSSQEKIQVALRTSSYNSADSHSNDPPPPGLLERRSSGGVEGTKRRLSNETSSKGRLVKNETAGGRKTETVPGVPILRTYELIR